MNYKYIILFILTSLQIQDCSTQVSTDSIKPPSDQDNIIVSPYQTMPYLFDCSHYETKPEKKECTDEIVLNIIYSNLQYPTEALKNETEGIAIIRFKVKKDSTVSDFEIVRDIGDGCGEEALRVVQLIPTKWIPATMMGRPIEVSYNIPVKFQL